MPEKKDYEPRIIVDTDWKEEAKKEKEEADRQTREAARKGPLPQAAFAEVVQMILLQATIGLGGMQDPSTGQQIPPNLPVAKHYIDLLELLRQKTANNLDDQEKSLLEGMLHELRITFVQVAGAGSPAPARR